MDANTWWKDAVFYQVYPRSFCDTSGDGVGDLEGLRQHLDHLSWLGVDAIWLSPFFRSPMADYGYDVSDYCDVDPLFGSLADFDRLIADCHDRGLRVIIDWVPNHTSDQHPWFQESRRSRDDPKRSWYYWRDGASPGRPPNNWKSTFLGGPAWTWDSGTRQWYMHTFLPQQPDLDWTNPAVVDAMHATLRFWLDRGVDGFRIDVAHLLGKDPALPDWEEGAEWLPGLGPASSTHEVMRDLRRLADEEPGRVLVGEVYILDTQKVARFYGTPAEPELHLAFNFVGLLAPWTARAWRDHVEAVQAAYRPVGAWPTWCLSNHDNPRHRTRYGSESRARAAAILLLGLQGTPFLYAGEELGLEDAAVAGDAVRDPGGRDGCRAPIPWTADPSHGWRGEQPWLPWPPDASARSVASAQADPESVANLYRRLLAVRRDSTALRRGTMTLLESPDGVLAWARRTDHAADERIVAVNFESAPADLALPGSWRVSVASDGRGEGQPFSGCLDADQAVVVRPA